MRDKYFALNERPICAKCRPTFVQRIERGDSTAAFWRAVLLGLGVAVLGAVAMALVVTVWPFARVFMLIPIGFCVGKAIMASTGKYGGRRYQYLSVALTYCAISVGQIVPAAREAEASEKRRAAIRADSNRTLATQGLALEEELAKLGTDTLYSDTTGSSVDEEDSVEEEPVEEDSLEALAQSDKPLEPPEESASAASAGRNALLVFFFLPILSMFDLGIQVFAVGLLALGYAIYQAWKRTDGQGLSLKLRGPFRVGTGPIPAM